MPSLQDTLRLDGAVVREPGASIARDKMPDLTRIVRHALMAAVASGPLDRAIRSAARSAGPLPNAGVDFDDRVRLVARRLNDLLVDQADPHRETVRS